VGLEERKPCFSLFHIPAEGCELALLYRPRFLTAGLIAAGIGLLGLAGMGMAVSRAARRRRPEKVPG
jgi:hypothetical protein